MAGKFISYDEYCARYQLQLLVNEEYEKAIEFLKGSKLYGFNIDTENYKEMIATLYFAYKNKEYTVNAFNKLLEMRNHGS